MTNESDPEKVRDEYLSRVKALFEQTRQWTTEIDEDARFTEETVTIKEEPVAAYEVNVLVISRPARKTVRLIPRGCWIIGAEGRVDIKSDLGTETLVYVLDGGPAIRIDLLTENGKILEEGKPRHLVNDVAEGWLFLQNRQLGMLPSLDASLFHRLLEVLGR